MTGPRAVPPVAQARPLPRPTTNGGPKPDRAPGQGRRRARARAERPVVVETEGLGRRHGEVDALVAVDLSVRAGTVLGILGHNGAGKTTLIDVLTTRIKPTRGRATVCGFDVTDDPAAVRSLIGVVTQYGALDGLISGHANLVLVARLLGATKAAARERADELIEVFDLVEAAARPVQTYSGGMRRRLDIAAGLLGGPEVLFLDEPTTGLDPVSRSALWDVIADIVRAGTAVVLTTQYLEEADRLADHLLVLGRGSVVATGTPATLKAELGTRTATVTPLDQRAVPFATNVLRSVGLAATPHDKTLVVPLGVAGDIARVVRALDAAGVVIADLAVAEPSLDDVFRRLFAGGMGP